MRTARLLALVLLALAAGLAGCTDPDAGSPSEGTDDRGDGPDDQPGGEPARTGVDWSQVPESGEVPDPDRERLTELVDRQVHNETGLRYRTPGTAGHEATVPILEDMLANASDAVETERFRADLPRLGEVNATNVYGIREGDPEREIWLAAHWDSRAWADQALDEDRREDPVLGANDGAAAVAVATHALELLPATNATVKVALFDVEDQGWQGEGWIQGSTHAAEQLDGTERDRIQALILVDMPGHEQLTIRREGHSEGEAPAVTNLTFGVADRLDASAFENTSGPAITDDHLPFLRRDVPAVDLIHLDRNGTSPFPWTWHTPHDTPEHVSADSMAEVTRVVTATAMAVDRGALPSDA